MKFATYVGIDYGRGQTNIDMETRIRYGIISQNEVMSEALDDVFTQGTDLGFENAEEELKGKLRGVLADYYSTSRLDDVIEQVFEDCDGWADNLDFNGPYRYEQDGYVIKAGGDDSDVWIFKSPYFTYAQFCSPCAPGACCLMNPINVEGEYSENVSGRSDALKTRFSDNRAYCLGADWFEDGKVPYPIYSVETGELVKS